MSSAEALLELLSPDGYYSYLEIPKPESPDSAIDLDKIKKNYRKLSLKHHPDKPTGDADTFRVLNRAQKVLSDEKLRKQYDALSIDLHDDDDSDGAETDAKEDPQQQPQQHGGKPSGVMQEIASTILTAIMQICIRTGKIDDIADFWLRRIPNKMFRAIYILVVMGIASVFVVRYRFTFYASLLFMAFVLFRIVQQAPKVPGGSLRDTIPPCIIVIGLSIMSHSAWGGKFSWSLRYWIGETLVIAMICYNSLNFMPLANPLIITAIFLFAALFALWFRGNFWNYLITVAFTGILAILVAFAFPMMELVLDVILQEKLKKVGERVRHQHKILKDYYESQKSKGSS